MKKAKKLGLVGILWGVYSWGHTAGWDKAKGQQTFVARLGDSIFKRK